LWGAWRRSLGQFGGAIQATDIVSERGDAGVDRIKELTDGIGADSVLECVGTKEAMTQAIQCAGAMIGYVGVPHGVEVDGQWLFFSQTGMLIDLVLERKIDPGKVFDLTLPLADVAEGYREMDERRAIKTLAARLVSGLRKSVGRWSDSALPASRQAARPERRWSVMQKLNLERAGSKSRPSGFGCMGLSHACGPPIAKRAGSP
jgi:hypothetical protein